MTRFINSGLLYRSGNTGSNCNSKKNNDDWRKIEDLAYHKDELLRRFQKMQKCFSGEENDKQDVIIEEFQKTLKVCKDKQSHVYYEKAKEFFKIDKIQNNLFEEKEIFDTKILSPNSKNVVIEKTKKEPFITMEDLCDLINEEIALQKLPANILQDPEYRGMKLMLGEKNAELYAKEKQIPHLKLILLSFSTIYNMIAQCQGYAYAIEILLFNLKNFENFKEINFQDKKIQDFIDHLCLEKAQDFMKTNYDTLDSILAPVFGYSEFSFFNLEDKDIFEINTFNKLENYFNKRKKEMTLLLKNKIKYFHSLVYEKEMAVYKKELDKIKQFKEKFSNAKIKLQNKKEEFKKKEKRFEELADIFKSNQLEMERLMGKKDKESEELKKTYWKREDEMLDLIFGIEDDATLDQLINEEKWAKQKGWRLPQKNQKQLEKLKLEAEFESSNNLTLASLMLLQQNLFNRGLGSLSQRHKDLLDQLKEEHKQN